MVVLHPYSVVCSLLQVFFPKIFIDIIKTKEKYIVPLSMGEILSFLA